MGFLARLRNHGDRSMFVRLYVERSNMEVMRLVTPAIVALSVLLFASTFMPLDLWAERSPEMLLCYRLEFAGMFATGGLFGYLSRAYLKKDHRQTGAGNHLMLGFVVLMVALSLWITILDYATMGRYFFLLVTLFTIFGLFFIPPVHVAVCELIVFVSVYKGLASIGLLSPIQLILLAAYLGVILAVSTSNYMACMRSARANEDMTDAARHDELTGMLNRRAFDEDIARLAGSDVALVLADIDEFKYYNDLLGHSTGDQLLLHFSDALANAFGTSRVYRFSGDEFIAVIEKPRADEASVVIEAARQAFHDGAVAGREHLATCSAGCVLGRSESVDDAYDLLRVADLLLSRSKENGRNQLTLATYSDGLLHEALAKSGLQNTLAENVDQLTGLVNTEAFVTRASETLPLLLRKDRSLSLAYFNVTNLKDYNAKYGFAQGDELLKFVARTLSQDVFPDCLVAHLGDDRFALLARDEGLSQSIERACALVADAHGGTLIMLRAGVFRCTSPDVEVRHALDCARIACDSLRGNFDVPYRYYTEELGDRMARRNRVLDSFKEALERGYIQPFYQPIVRTASDLVCDFEILARWIDPQEGMMSPADFIPTLEDAHLIHRLDLHIVEEVCKNYHRFKARGLGNCPVSINFSRLDFEACDVVSEVVGLLDRYGVPHEYLCAELTESALADDSDLIKLALKRFQAEGIQVWMDDFGSGYSALNVLREYDFDLIKFDMSFVRGMDVTDPDDPSGIMLTNLVAMAKELGVQTLIEGVEDVDRLLFLRHISFEKVQGFVFGKPQSFDELCGKLEDWSYVIEEIEKRTYYDEVGRIDLMHPIEQGSSFDPQGIAHGVPVAVMECDQGGVLRYLEQNAPFEELLRSKGFDSPMDAELFLNMASSQRNENIVGELEALRATDEWLQVGTGGVSPRDGYARVVTRVPEADAFAFMLYLPPVS